MGVRCSRDRSQLCFGFTETLVFSSRWRGIQKRRHGKLTVRTMEPFKSNNRKSGGRPPKVIKSNHFIGVKCSLIEKTLLKQKAKRDGITLSEYLREAGLNRKEARKITALPKEVLQFTGALNHLAANLNQLARKSNQFGELNTIERLNLEKLSNQIKELATAIKTFIP
jgi:hypothetical protein